MAESPIIEQKPAIIPQKPNFIQRYLPRLVMMTLPLTLTPACGSSLSNAELGIPEGQAQELQSGAQIELITGHLSLKEELNVRNAPRISDNVDPIGETLIDNMHPGEYNIVNARVVKSQDVSGGTSEDGPYWLEFYEPGDRNPRYISLWAISNDFTRVSTKEVKFSHIDSEGNLFIFFEDGSLQMTTSRISIAPPTQNK